jgi:hypothetical protein
MDRDAFADSLNSGRAGFLRDAGFARRGRADAPQPTSADGAADLVARALEILAQESACVGSAQTPHRPEMALTPSNIAVKSIVPAPRVERHGLEIQRRVLGDGTECPLPIRYFDVQCLVATFLARAERAAELLGGTGLQPVVQEDGKAVVRLYCIEYRETDIGAYNEVGLTVLARAPGEHAPADFVVDLPVTTAVAERAGREIWGYNKFIAAIDIEKRDKTFTTFLRDSQYGLICAFVGTRGPSVPAPPEDILTFTIHNGRLMKTAIRVLTPFHASRGDGFALKVGTSSHPMTSRLRAAEIDGAQPVLVHYADPFQSLLFPGRTL